MSPRRRDGSHEEEESRYNFFPAVRSVMLLALWFVADQHLYVLGFTLPLQAGQRRRDRAILSSSLQMNLLSDLGDMMSGGKLVSQVDRPLPYGRPLEEQQTTATRTLAIAERGMSFTGEDFDVFDAETGSPYCRVRGAMLHLPGKDKMRVLQEDGTVMAELDRKLVAMTPTYDLYRGYGDDKIGWIEKAVVAMTDTFEVHMEGEGGFGPFKPPAAYKIEGDFVDRNFVMRNQDGQVVAKFFKDGWVQFDAFNHYQVQIAPGMDAGLVVACACAIDEEFDEEHRAKEGGGSGWLPRL